MSLLARATARKGIDQEAMSAQPGGVYIPLENRSTWTGQNWMGDVGALNIATFYACVRVLAESVASLPLMLYRRLPGGGKERATDHELYPTLHDAPNPAMTSFVWRELLMSHAAAWGDHFSEKVIDSFGSLQLWPIRPDRIDVYWSKSGNKEYDYLSPSGQRTAFKPGSIFHVPALSSDGLRGYSPVALHRQTLKSHNAARDFGEAFFRNGARPATVLSHPKTLSEGAVTRLAGQMDDLRGAKQAGKTVILEEGLTITEVGIPPDDAQYMETRVFEAREIQKIFRMPPHMVGDLERATFSNIEHQGIEFVVYTLRPWLVRIEQEIKAQLLFNQPDIFAEFLVDGLLRGDAQGRATSLQIQRQNGIINGDEWREIENLNPIEDGSGKEYWMPANFQLATTDTADTALPGEIVDTTRPPLFAVKSSQVRCPNGHLLAELATPPYRFTCRRCKSVTEADAVAEPEKAADPIAVALMALATREQPAPSVTLSEGMVRVEVHPGEAPQIIVNVPEQPPANVSVTMPEPHRITRRIERDKENNIVKIVEVPA